MRIVEQRPIIRSAPRASAVARTVPENYWDDLEERNETRSFLLMGIGGILIPLLLTAIVYFQFF